MISIDEFSHKKAKEKGLNISSICEDALIRRINPKKSDAPEEAIKLICKECNSIVDYGFLCELTNMFLCSECNLTKRCLNKEHEHIRLPGFDGQRMDLTKKIIEDAK